MLIPVVERLFENDPDAIPAGILDIEDRPIGAERDGLLDVGELLRRQARDPGQGEAAQGQRHAQVDDPAPTLLNLDSGESRPAAR